MSGFRKLVEAISKGEKIDEKAPKGWEGTVKAMKGKEGVDNPYALAHHMKKKGYKSHKGPRGGSKKESIQVEGRVVEHPVEGRGVVVGLAEDQVKVRWDNLSKRLLGPETFTFEEAGKYLKLLGENEYTDDPEDADMTKKGKVSKKADHKKGKKRTDEAWMGEIPGTYRDRGDKSYDSDSIVFDLTAADIGLLEDEQEGTGHDKSAQSDFDAGSDEPLSTEDGDESHTEEGPHEEDNMPDDAPDVPDYREMEDQAGPGNKRSTNRPGKGSGDGGSKRAAKDRDESDDSQKDERPDFMKKTKTNEGLSLADFDTDGMLTESQRGTAFKLREMQHDFEDDLDADLELDDDMDEGYGHDPRMKETHDPDSDLAMTRAFAEKLFGAIANQNPDDGMIGTIIDGVLACGAEKGETLDVEDIGSCMAKIKELHAGGSADAEMGDGDMDGDMEMDSDDDGELEYEDKAEGDGEEAGAEAGPEHEGKTKLMADDDDDDGDDDIDDDDDGIPDWEDEKPKTPNRAKEGHEDDDDDDDDKPKAKNGSKRTDESRRPRSKKKRTDESLVAMGMAGIKGTHRGNDASIADVDHQEEDDDAELQMILRRSGMKYWND